MKFKKTNKEKIKFQIQVFRLQKKIWSRKSISNFIYNLDKRNKN